MKFPKNRENVYVVVRTIYTDGGREWTTCGCFPTPEQADDFKGSCEQEWLDKYGDLHEVDFDIQLTTFYG